jgi:hypothetical protein
VNDLIQQVERCMARAGSQPAVAAPPLTYGELRRTPAGWVTSHVIKDICENQRWALGASWALQVVSAFDRQTIREKAIHFGETIPAALAETPA